MSKGPGRIERAIMAAVDAEPDNAFTVADLCDRAFPGLNRIEKKHRVSVIRAMKAIVRRNGCLDYLNGPITLVLYDPGNVMSYATARMKTGDWPCYYRRSPVGTASEQEAELRLRLAPGGDHHNHIVEGAGWWRHAAMVRAERRGDLAKLAALEEEQESAVRRVMAAFQARRSIGGSADTPSAQLTREIQRCKRFAPSLVTPRGG